MHTQRQRDPLTQTVNTHKSSLQVPAPAVVQEANNDSSHKVTNQDGQIGHLNVRHNQLHKLLHSIRNQQEKKIKLSTNKNWPGVMRQLVSSV